jgi:hypothetical protein
MAERHLVMAAGLTRVEATGTFQRRQRSNGIAQRKAQNALVDMGVHQVWRQRRRLLEAVQRPPGIAGGPQRNAKMIPARGILRLQRNGTPERFRSGGGFAQVESDQAQVVMRLDPAGSPLQGLQQVLRGILQPALILPHHGEHEMSGCQVGVDIERMLQMGGGEFTIAARIGDLASRNQASASRGLHFRICCRRVSAVARSPPFCASTAWLRQACRSASGVAT